MFAEKGESGIYIKNNGGVRGNPLPVLSPSVVDHVGQAGGFVDRVAQGPKLRKDEPGRGSRGSTRLEDRKGGQKGGGAAGQTGAENDDSGRRAGKTDKAESRNGTYLFDDGFRKSLTHDGGGEGRFGSKVAAGG